MKQAAARPAEDLIDQADALVREWLADPEVTIVCGRWSDGGVMEIVPEGQATLSRRVYDPPYAGLRDLHLKGQGHHVHLDLAKLSRATYAVLPSVCYAFRPSFEVRLHDPSAESLDTFGLALSVSRPYRGKRLVREAADAYFRRFLDHVRRFPGLVSFRADDGGRRADELPATWAAIGESFRRAAGDLAPVRAPRTAPELEAAIQALRMVPRADGGD